MLNYLLFSTSTVFTQASKFSFNVFKLYLIGTFFLLFSFSKYKCGIFYLFTLRFVLYSLPFTNLSFLLLNNDGNIHNANTLTYQKHKIVRIIFKFLKILSCKFTAFFYLDFLNSFFFIEMQCSFNRDQTNFNIK